jgi:outer membrane protein TolC
MTLGIRPLAIILFAALSLAGCTTSALDLTPQRAVAPWVSATSAAGAVQPGPDAAGYVLAPNPALAVIPPLPQIDPSRAYTLPELIDIAESDNPLTRIAWDDARKAALAAGIAQSSYLPNITAVAVGADQASDAQSSGFGEDANGGNEAHGVISAVSLQWLLFDFGGRSAAIEAAKQLSVISDIGFTAAHQQVIYNVSLAFYAYQAARADDVSAAQALQNAQRVQAAATARHSHGIGTVTAVAQANQTTAQEALAKVQSDGGVQDAYLALLTAMGVSPLANIKIAFLVPRQLTTALDTPVQNVVAAALARRPDMLSAAAARQASLADIRVAQAAFLPKIFLSATGSYSSAGLTVTSIPAFGQEAGTENLSGSHLNGTILAGVTFPLYDGGMRAGMLAQADAAADAADANLTEERNEAVRQIVSAQNAIRTSLAAYAAAQALENASQTVYASAFAAFRSGEGSITAAIIAQTQLLQAKDVETDAYSTALSSAATLALETGLLGAAPP